MKANFFLRKIVMGLFFCLLTFGLYAQTGNKALLGIYHGSQGWAMDDVDAMELWQGKKHAVVTLFTMWYMRTKDMNNLFGQQLPNIWNQGSVPIITWEPFVNSPQQTPVDVEVRAANGEYDDYFTTWSSRLKNEFLAGPDSIYGNSDDRRVYIRMGHEMNGDWYPWSAAVGNNSPQDYINMWVHVHQIFSAQGIDSSHVQWIWAPNNDDVGGFTAEDYWPGEGYVDWIGIDGYNWGGLEAWSSWKSPAETFDNMLGRVRLLGDLPVGLTEFASTSFDETGVHNISLKGQWITDFFDYVLVNDIRLVSWFNEDKETDWAVYQAERGNESLGPNSFAYTEYKSAVLNSSYISPDMGNPRLLTDNEFAGDFFSQATPTPDSTPIPSSTPAPTPTASPTPTSTPVPDNSIHVSSITMDFNTTGPNWQGTAVIAVVDQNNLPVEGAVVSGSWSGLVTGGDMDKVTDYTGSAGPFYSEKSGSSGIINFCVDNIVVAGYSYSPGDNLESCGSVTH